MVQVPLVVGVASLRYVVPSTQVGWALHAKLLVVPLQVPDL